MRSLILSMGCLLSWLVPFSAAGQVCPGGAPQCGGVCCAPAEICPHGTCAPLGPACAAGAAACDPTEYCEPSANACLPRTALPACQFRPPIGAFDPVVRWGWHGSDILPDHRYVMMTPVVAQTTDDDGDGLIDHRDIPDVIFSTYVSGGSHAEEGVLRAVSGDDGRELWTADDPDLRVNGLGAIAVGDIDGDGFVEIVTSAFAGRGVWASGLRAFEHDGTPKWRTAEDWVTGWGGPALADLDGDGAVEVVIGRVVLNGLDGSLRCAAMDAGGQGDHDGRRPLSFPADLDGDGRMEIVTGNAVYDADCQPVWVDADEIDGFPAVADFDGDGDPEIVVVFRGGARLVDHRGEVLARTLDIPGAADPGGAPTIADFDGDGRLEFATAGSSAYVVLAPNAALDGIDVLWSAETQDRSSRVTGSSVFDFEGDGQAEVVYNDECYMRVYRGRDGHVLFEAPNPSATTYEYPLVVDVDNDGRAEILSVANGIGGSCPWYDAAADPPVAGPGLRAFADRRGNWVGTRTIWNQHAYSVTHVCDGLGEVCEGPDDRHGAIPRQVRPHWQTPWANSFRQNVQGDAAFFAPDVRPVRVTVQPHGCPPVLQVDFEVFNQGQDPVAPGLAATLYDPNGGVVGVAYTRGRLEPGGREAMSIRSEAAGLAWFEQAVEFLLAVDDDAGFQAYGECDEANNEARVPVEMTAEGAVDPSPCATGEPGVCAAGVRMCIAGEVGCQPEGQAGDEQCNAADDDCDGAIDEGQRDLCGRCGEAVADGCDAIDDDCDGRVDEDAMCPPRLTCVRGRCVGPCSAGECPEAGLTCVDGVCIEPCAVVTCEPGWRCEAGICHDPCAEVDCPARQICRDGACAPADCRVSGCLPGQLCRGEVCAPDPCHGVACPDGAACRDGACVGSCATVACALDAACVDGECVPHPCGRRCPEGAACVDGACEAPSCPEACPDGRICRDDACVDDPCATTRCPPGQACRIGADGSAQCAYPPPAAPAPDAGPDAALAPDAGPDAAPEPDAAPALDRGAPDAADAGPPPPGAEPGESERAQVVGCAVEPGHRGPGAPTWPLWAVALALIARRERRR